jgi:hypothetical protein
MEKFTPKVMRKLEYPLDYWDFGIQNFQSA